MMVIGGLEKRPRRAKEPREKHIGIDETQTEEFGL